MKCLPIFKFKIEVFIIIGVGGSNIDSQWIFFMEEFFEIIMYIWVVCFGMGMTIMSLTLANGLYTAHL